MKYVSHVMIAILAFIMLAGFSAQAEISLLIATRDGSGQPLAGVPVQLLLAGPPQQPYGGCVTAEDGSCALSLPPGAYAIRFEGDWAGLPFVPASQQNSGALADAGGSGGGFGIYLAPGGDPQVVTFVIGTRDGQLVPLWDMSRDLRAEPQPFAVPDNPFDTPDGALAGIDLGPLDAHNPFPDSSNGAQVVEDRLQVGAAPTAVPATPKSDALAGSRERVRSAGNTGLDLAALAAVGALLTGLAFVARALRHKTSAGDTHG